MKSKLHRSLIVLAMLALSALNSEFSTACAQGTFFTYQGQVQDNGSNFTGSGQFKFALVASSNANLQATATAIMGGASPHEFVNNFLINSGGSGYVTPPAVAITGGGGSGASAQTTISGGVVNSVSIINPGSGYTSTPTVTIAAPPADITYVTYWSNDGTSVAGSEPTAAVEVGVNNGLFTVELGDTTLANMMAIPVSVFTDEPSLQLRIWFNDGVNGFAALSPVQDLTPTPYAIFANTASNLSGTLPAAQLSGTIPLAQLPGAVVTNDDSANVTLDNLTLGGTLYLPAVPATIYTGGSLLLQADALENLFVGPGAGNLTLSGGQNVGIGYSALPSDSNGEENTATGWLALWLNTSGSGNTADGSAALALNTNGSENTATGIAAMEYNTRGSQNTASGAYALSLNETGSNNVAVGFEALYDNPSNNDNVAVGYQALYASTNDIGAVAIGYQALQNEIAGNTHGFTPSSNGENTAVGYQSLQSDTTGAANTALGYLALNMNMSGYSDTAIGDSALRYNTSGIGNTALGAYALLTNSMGEGNTCIGWSSMYYTTNANENTAIGTAALQALGSGDGNIAIGDYAGINLGIGTNNIYIGTYGGAYTESGITRIGTTDDQTNAFIAGIFGVTAASGVPVYVNSSGQLGTFTSSARFKQDIRSMDEASDVLLSLRPVTFRYKPELDPQGIPQFGLIAEDVDKLDPGLVARDDKHQIYTVRYEAVNAMLLNEFLKEHRKVEAQETEIETLKAKSAKVDLLEKQNDSLAQRLNELEATVRQLAAPK